MDEAAEIAKWHINDGFIKDNKKAVHMRSEFGELKTQSLIDTATDAVATDGGFKDFFRDDNTKTLMMVSIRCVN